jgi:hypothetical protein
LVKWCSIYCCIVICSSKCCMRMMGDQKVIWPQGLWHIFSPFFVGIYFFFVVILFHITRLPPMARLCLLVFKIEPFINLLWNSIFAEQQMTKVKNLWTKGLLLNLWKHFWPNFCPNWHVRQVHNLNSYNVVFHYWSLEVQKRVLDNILLTNLTKSL